MTQQKSEDRVVPKGRGNTIPTRRQAEGGKAVPVNEEARQLWLFPEITEKPAGVGTVGKSARRPRRADVRAGFRSENKGEKVKPATIEAVSERMFEAFENVARNRGAPGPDGVTIDEMRECLVDVIPKLKTALLTGQFMPGEIRRKWIPKGGGGQRGLGIPNVIDRVVHEAVRLEIEPLYEPTFHASSHGFRPGRSCHTAIAQAIGYVDEGYGMVVDIDVEKFFDGVNHQRLMSRLAERIDDKALLVLIGHMLKAKVVMPDGVVVSNDEGVPQGGPLSPLLSNIVLDELDQELARRRLRFVRYADDANIYVRSERSGKRVMASVKRFIERRLRLKVNEAKSAVALPEERHFLGFRLRREPLDGSVEVLLSKRSKDRIDEKIRELTPRTWGRSVKDCILGVNRYVVGWIGFFGICTDGEARTLGALDAHIRRRLRAIQLRHWKRKRTIYRKLQEMGASARSAGRAVYDGRRSIWAMSHSSAVDRALRNSHWDAQGLKSLHELWRQIQKTKVAPKQQLLFG